MTRLAKPTFALACLCLLALPAAALELKIATLAPEGAAWMVKMRAAAAEIEQRTAGRVSFRFYPGGVMGTDATVLRKMRIGQLHGGALSSGALDAVYPDNQLYGLPLLFRSHHEVDAVRAKLDPLLMRGLEDKGFISFGYAGGGFAYLMSKEPVRSVPDLKQVKVWTPQGDEVSRTAFDRLGIKPIPLALADVNTGLQTGLIETVVAPPAVSIVMQWHARVRYLTDVPLLYIYALLAIDKRAFDRIGAADQAIVREVMEQAFREFDAQNRVDNERAREALQGQGIEFVAPSREELARWHEVAAETVRSLEESTAYTPALVEALHGILTSVRGGRSSVAEQR